MHDKEIRLQHPIVTKELGDNEKLKSVFIF
jgi:hypothetical protein